MATALHEIEVAPDCRNSSGALVLAAAGTAAVAWLLKDAR
jgi:hypothetical protein